MLLQDCENCLRGWGEGGGNGGSSLQLSGFFYAPYKSNGRVMQAAIILSRDLVGQFTKWKPTAKEVTIPFVHELPSDNKQKNPKHRPLERGRKRELARTRGSK